MVKTKSTVAKNRPINIRAQLFALDGASGNALDVRTSFGRSGAAFPLIDRLGRHAHELR